MDTSIFTQIFKGEVVTEEYLDACNMLLEALKCRGQEEESLLYEQAAFLFEKTQKKEWKDHLIKVAQRIDEHNKRKGLFQNANI